MAQGNSIKVRLYLKPELFSEMCKEAEKAGCRRKGLQLTTQKEHGFSHERLANTDGLGKFLKYCYNYYMEHEAQRLEEAAQIKRQEMELEERKKKIGVI